MSFIGIGMALRSSAVHTSGGAGDLVNTTPPTITGTFFKGQPIQGTNGVWVGSPTSFTYQWYRGSLSNPIDGATNLRYIPVMADVGSVPILKVTARKFPFSSSVVYSGGSEVSIPVGAKTASGVTLASVSSGATVTGSTGVSTYYSINGSGVVSVTSAGDTADLGSGTYDVPLTNSGLVSGKLKFTVEANTFDVDTNAALTAAISATSSGLTTNWTIAIPEGIFLPSAVSITQGYSGTLVNPNSGLGTDDMVANPLVINRQAVATVTGGSLTIKSRGLKTSGFGSTVTSTGAVGPLIFQDLAHQAIPSTDAYDAKFTSVIQPLIWTPTVSGGAVTGVGAIIQNGIGYLASPNERRCYVSYKSSGAGTGFEGYFDANPDGTIDINSPLTITSGGSAHTTGTTFTDWPLGLSVQRGLCQSNSLSSKSLYQSQMVASGSNLGRVAWIRCGFGTTTATGGNVNRVATGVFVRNATQAYIQDCSFDGIFCAVMMGFADDWEVARSTLINYANDFVEEYPATSLVGSQATVGSKGRMYDNTVWKPFQVVDWSNSHSDLHQVAAPGDLPEIRDFVVIYNYMFTPVSMRFFLSQGELNSLVAMNQKQYIANNFIASTMPNLAQLANARSTNTAKYLRNTGVRIIEEYLNDNVFSNGQPASVEPWMNYRGTYNAGTAYLLGYVVLYSGVYYECINASGATGQQPDISPTYWKVLVGFDMQISDNIIGAIWEHSSFGSYNRKVDPGGDGYTTAKNGDPLYTSVPFKYQATGNAYVSNYTANTNAGTSYPEVFAGGTAVFDTYDSNTGWRNYGSKFRQDTAENLRADIDAYFAPKVGSIAYGKGHLATPAPITFARTDIYFDNSYITFDQT